MDGTQHDFKQRSVEKEKEKEKEKQKQFDEDVPVCICGKPYIVLLVAECYDGSGVQCDECGKSLPFTSNVYHCPADKNNILHDQGYDLCRDCYNKLSDQVNTENVLFQIWFICNGLNKKLYQILSHKFEINSRKSLISKSSYSIYEFVSSINWDQFDHNSTTKKLFYDKYDQLRKTHLSLKKSAYKFVPEQQQQQQPQQQHTHNNYQSLSNNYSTHSTQAFHNPAPQLRFMSARTSRNCAMMQQQQSVSHSMHQTKSLSRNINTHCRKRSARNSYSHSRTHCRSAISNENAIQRTATNVDKNIGFSMGGAQDINSFRLCIENKQIPQLNSISYQGIFNEYYFDTNAGDHEMDIEEKEKEELPIFYPSYSYSKSMIPSALMDNNNITNDMIEFDEGEDEKQFEHFVVVGLNSNIREKDFQRKQLNLVVVLDISGSMGSTFNNNDNYQDRKTKMEVANQCLLLLLTHLTPEDRFGLVLFDNCSEIKINISKMKNVKMKQIEDILNISERGGTNFEAGYRGGISMFDSIDLNDDLYENRLIFLTDARPNSGFTDPNSLLNLVKTAADNDVNTKRIYTTFIGIGIDFNSDLISEISDVRGCNYFSVHTNKEFKKKLCSEFDYFVSPMVFNLELTLFCEGSKYNAIENVFGSDNINIKNGEIMSIKTLFPSPPNDDGDIKGGIILIQLNKKNVIQQFPYFVEITFEDKFGKHFQHKQCVNLIYDDDNNNNNEIYPNLGIRKSLLLTRYVSLLKNWINSNDKLNYKQIFHQFKNYFKKEMKCVEDDTLKQEIKILNKLINW